MRPVPRNSERTLRNYFKIPFWDFEFVASLSTGFLPADHCFRLRRLRSRTTQKEWVLGTFKEHSDALRHDGVPSGTVESEGTSGTGGLSMFSVNSFSLHRGTSRYGVRRSVPTETSLYGVRSVNRGYVSRGQRQVPVFRKDERSDCASSVFQEVSCSHSR